MRIHKSRLYLMSTVPGLSGFQRWGERERWITTGAKAASQRLDVEREWDIGECGRYELCDGHLPGHRPFAGPDEALAWLRDNPFQSIIPA